VSVTRRVFLAGGALALANACRGGRDAAGPDVRPPLSRVAVLPAPTYQADLAQRVRAGLRECRLDVRGLRVVLKPNLVEFDPKGAINTHPALIAAAAEAFLLEGARRVVVAEGPGHRRDNEYLLAASGLDALLRERRLSYVDLNFDDLRLHPLRSRFSELGQLYLPRTVMEADLFVSMPKLKTHHWAGVTLAMKNLFGIVPGAVYGWPKNPLHWAGIDASIVDLASTIPSRRFAIVDGIVGMEGNGPIQGEAKSVGVLVMGHDFVAVDATCARLMGLAPERVRHIAAAGEFLGNADEERIEQIAEPISRHVSPFAVLPAWDHLRA
jgi:uncharacterized protein (DUF362 family)